jgi:hypothetical protein
MMRRVLLSVVMFGMFAVGAARHADATTTVEHDTMIGRQTFIFFSVSKACDSTRFANVNGVIVGAESISRTTGTPATRSNSVTVEIFGYSNDCTGAFFGDATGLSQGGVVGPGPALTVAAINTTLTVAEDFGAGPQAQLTLHLAVTGSGPISNSASTTETHTFKPFTLTISRSANANRAATVSGTLKISGAGFADTFDMGGISATFNGNTNSSLTVTKP